MENDKPRRDYTQRPAAPKAARNVFGIFMILVYLGMGVLCFIGFFGTEGWWSWLRWVAGGLFTLYGIWRGYRQFANLD